MAPRPHTEAKRTATELLREARALGWGRVAIVFLPDGSMQFDASMGEEIGSDEFDVPNLKMGRP